MPFVSKHTTDDAWRTEAIRLADIIRKGPGSPHQRVDAIHQALIATAAENFAAGKTEGASAATPVSMMGELEHLRAENAALKAKPKVVQELPVTDADLMEAMRMAEGGLNGPGVNREQVEPLCDTVKRLAMEVAKLRYQAKAAAK